MGAWWTLWMLNVHPVWSIATPIALAEALFADRAERPWLGRVGRIAMSAIFVLGLAGNFVLSMRQERFTASGFQFAIAAALVALFLVLALAHRRILAGIRRSRVGPTAPGPWVTGGCAFVAASATLMVAPAWGWWAFGALLALDLVFLALALRWFARRGWSRMNSFSLAAAAALAYSWHGFIQPPVVGSANAITRIGNGVFAFGAIAIIWIGATRIRCTAEEQPASAK
jgi:uncharacterized membrane protein HdeD (DUF308 family)